MCNVFLKLNYITKKLLLILSYVAILRLRLCFLYKHSSNVFTLSFHTLFEESLFPWLKDS